jgi:two-component system cell cycle response regulator
MRQGESQNDGEDPSNKLVSSVRPRSEAAIRLSQNDRERVTLTRLQASLPPLEPIREDPLALLGSSRETPHAIVLPTTTRADRVTLTLLRGAGVGTTFTLEREETILGRGTKADIILDEPSISREHARIVIDASGAYFIEDLGSTNGTFVGGQSVQRAQLASGDRVQLGGEYTFRFAILDEEEESLQRRLYESSSRDILTGLMNRATLFEHLTRAIERTKREGGDVAILMIDADHFKSVNDRFGHAMGDEVLRAIAAAGAGALREGDLFARYGGEEFAVLARGGLADAADLAERFRVAVQALRAGAGDDALDVTVSIGIAALSECAIVDGVELFARADARLYAAKLNGRNRVCASV